MLPTSRLILALLFLSLVTEASRAQSAEEIRQGFMNGQVIVSFDPARLGLEEQPEAIEKMGFEILHRYPLIDAYWLQSRSDESVAALLERFEARDDLRWVQRNDLGRRSQTVPNDSSFGNCYALDNNGQTVNGDPGTSDADMDVTEAWDLITDASSVTIAVVDSGCRTTHTDLASNIWTNPGEIAGNGIDDDNNGKIDDVIGWDFLDGDGTPTDFDGHGTQVTGCIAMKGNNGFGGSGVCWSAQVMIVKDGNTFPQIALSAAGIEYAAMNGAVVCNFSTGYGSGNFPALQQAVNVAENLGMIICVAAGNSTQNIDVVSDAPATYSNANLLVVAASNNDDNLSNFSNFGLANVDLAAPGQSIYTTSRFSDTTFTYVSGTSFSAPMATGCVGLMRAYNPTASVATLISTLISTCDTKTSMSGKVASGGRLNLNSALIVLGSGSSGGGAPSPDPMTFSVNPSLMSNTMATMRATMAGPGPVEYKFDLVSSTGTGGNSSPWQANAVYDDGGLSANAEFRWSVRARNASSLAETQPSIAMPLFTPANIPGMVSIKNQSNGGFEIDTIALNDNPTYTLLSIRVGGLFADLGGQLQTVEFFQTAASWKGVVVKGLSPLSAYLVNARAKNGSGLLSSFGPTTLAVTGLLGPAAQGDISDQNGEKEDVFFINGSSGGLARVVSIGVGQPFSFDILNPSGMAQPANFAIIAWWGIPDKSFEFDIPAPIGHGTLCFTPCEVNPGLPTFNIVSTFGSNCGELIAADSLAPWCADNPGYPFPLPQMTLQAIVEDAPGVLGAGNAIVFRYQ